MHNRKNIEFKARVTNASLMEEKLRSLSPRFVGIDHQTDTYFRAATGRLKLREGNIEHALIQYHREDSAAAKLSEVLLYSHAPHPALKEILTAQLGVLAVVVKERRIYFIDNVKFHFDRVQGLGEFVEVEAIDADGTHSLESLQAQCDRYFRFFELCQESLLTHSYSDMSPLSAPGRGT